MKTLTLCLSLLLTAVTVRAAEPMSETYSDHAAFYGHVAQHEGLKFLLQRRPLPAVGPDSSQLVVSGLSRYWGRVLLRHDGIVIDERPLSWAGAARPFGRTGPVGIDLEIAQLWETQPLRGGASTLCVQSPAGSSASAARWQHVILIERPTARARPAAQAWTGPYASCEALWVRDGLGWIAGVFEFTFESERAVGKAAFTLQSLRQGEEVARYVLTLSDPANLFSFKAVRGTVQ